MAKSTTIEQRLKKAFADLYKLASSLPDSIEKISIEGKTLTIHYKHENNAVTTLYGSRADGLNWCDDIPYFTIELEEMKLLKEPKAIGNINIYPEKIVIDVPKANCSISLDIINKNPDYNPVTELASSYEWEPVELPKEDIIDIDAKTGLACVPGAMKATKRSANIDENQPEDIVRLDKRHIPKAFTKGETETYICVIDDTKESDGETSGIPFMIFANEKFNAIVEFDRILTNV